MPTRTDAHLPIAHSAPGATIADTAMAPDTSVFAKHRVAHPVIPLGANGSKAIRRSPWCFGSAAIGSQCASKARIYRPRYNRLDSMAGLGLGFVPSFWDSAVSVRTVPSRRFCEPVAKPETMSCRCLQMHIFQLPAALPTRTSPYRPWSPLLLC